MYKAILIVYIGIFGQPNLETDFNMVVPAITMEACMSTRDAVLQKFKAEQPNAGTMYLVECLPAEKTLVIVGNRS